MKISKVDKGRVATYNNVNGGMKNGYCKVTRFIEEDA